MNSRSLWLLGTLTGLAVMAACATPRAPEDNPANIKTETASAELRSDRVRNWTVVDDQTLIIESYEGVKYKAETMGACNGLSFATRLGFSSRGGFKQIDRFSSVLLPDGTKCSLAAFNKVIAPEKSALDSYEKATKEADEKAGKEAADQDAKDKADQEQAGKAAGEANGSATPR